VAIGMCARAGLQWKRGRQTNAFCTHHATL
jgi:hypothetical protein